MPEPSLPFGRTKPEKRLEAQLKTAEKRLGEELIPPSESKEELMKLSPAELKERFPVRYNLYLAALRAKSKSGELGAMERSFFSNSKEQLVSYLTFLNNIDRYISEQEESEEGVLHEHQLEIFKTISQALEQGESAGYVSLPTGFGKTVLFSQIVRAANVPTLIVVPTKQLVGQTGEKFTAFAKEMQVGGIHSRKKKSELDQAKQSLVQVITYQSLQSYLKQGKIDPSKFKLLVLDEVHQALSEQRQALVEQFPQAVKIGFTATPVYAEDKQVSMMLPKEYVRFTVKDAIEEGYLADCRTMIVKTRVDLSQIPIDNGEYRQTDLEKAVNVESRNRAAVELYEQAFQGQGAIAFCVSIKHAENVVKEFKKHKIIAEVVSGNTSSEDLKKILEKFERSDIDVLANANLLVEGFDSERASVCLNLAPTASLVRAEQRPGRILRLDPNDPNKLATVVDFLDDYAEKKGPILYGDILKQAAVFKKKRGKRDEGGEHIVREPPPISIEGVEVIWKIEGVEVVLKKNKVIVEKKKEFPVWEEFVKEVQEWVEQLKKRKKEPSISIYRQTNEAKNWPYSPYEHYKGWASWPELWGEEKKEKKELPSWDVFSAEVQAWINELKMEKKEPGESMYKQVYKTKNWPSNPDKTYRGKGWASWPELWQKKEFPGWGGFIKEVQEWIEELKKEKKEPSASMYKQVYKTKNWPSHPHVFYKDKGWASWPELWGEEKKEKKELPSWDVFSAEVQTWVEELRKEKKEPSISLYQQVYRAKNWPSSPDVFYRNKGWSSWPTLWGANNKK